MEKNPDGKEQVQGTAVEIYSLAFLIARTILPFSGPRSVKVHDNALV